MSSGWARENDVWAKGRFRLIHPASLCRTYLETASQFSNNNDSNKQWPLHSSRLDEWLAPIWSTEDKQKEATVHFQSQWTLHFLQKYTLKTCWHSFLQKSLSDLWKTNIAKKWRPKCLQIQKQTDVVEMAKFSPLKVHYSLLLITIHNPWCITIFADTEIVNWLLCLSHLTGKIDFTDLNLGYICWSLAHDSNTGNQHDINAHLVSYSNVLLPRQPCWSMSEEMLGLICN